MFRVRLKGYGTNLLREEDGNIPQIVLIVLKLHLVLAVLGLAKVFCVEWQDWGKWEEMRLVQFPL